jgi:hypothetical protein
MSQTCFRRDETICEQISCVFSDHEDQIVLMAGASSMHSVVKSSRVDMGHLTY